MDIMNGRITREKEIKPYRKKFFWIFVQINGIKEWEKKTK